MNGKVFRITALFVSLLLFSGVVFAQKTEDFKRGPFSSTIFGNTGLITIFSADTLKKGEFAFSFAHHNYDRSPGDFDINVNPVAFTFALSNRFELSLTANFNQSVEADGKKFPPSTSLSAKQPPWRYIYYHDFPFMDRGFNSTNYSNHQGYGNGMGDIMGAVKINITSEENGSAMGFALRPWIKIPSARNQQWLRRGRGTGEVDAGFDLILAKNIGPVGTYYNAGVAFIGDPGSNGRDLLDLRDELRLGFGMNFPILRSLQGIVEVNNKTFIGGGTPIAGPVNPLDIFAGLRYYPSEWMSIGGGIRQNLNATDESAGPPHYTYSSDHTGFTVQMAFQKRVNAMPVVNCDIQKSTLIEGENTTLTASGTDRDYNAKLDYKWTATGGRVSGDGRNATWYSESSKPGSYTVTVSLTDNHGATVSCSKDITLNKKNYCPTVTLAPKTATVMIGESARFKATGSDQNQDKLTYAWTIGTEKVASTTDEIVFGSAGRKPGTYPISVTVSDGVCTGTDSASVTVNAIPNKAPTVQCSAEKGEVMSGERLAFTAQGNDPDKDSLSYQWSASNGRVEGSGNRVTFDTTGLTAGTYVLTVRISDGRGGNASSTCSVNVRERIRIMVDKVRIDNVAKAVLDDIALKMQNERRIQAVITGYVDESGTKKTQEKGAQDRADEVKKYLVEKHKVDPNRLTAKSAGASDPIAPSKTAEGRKQNRRAEVELYIP